MNEYGKKRDMFSESMGETSSGKFPI